MFALLQRIVYSKTYEIISIYKEFTVTFGEEVSLNKINVTNKSDAWQLKDRVNIVKKVITDCGLYKPPKLNNKKVKISKLGGEEYKENIKIVKRDGSDGKIHKLM